MRKFRRQYQTKKTILREQECVLDHNRHLRRVVAGRREGRKEEARRGCLQRQDRTERDFECGDGDECAVVGMDSWRD